MSPPPPPPPQQPCPPLSLPFYFIYEWPRLYCLIFITMSFETHTFLTSTWTLPSQSSLFQQIHVLIKQSSVPPATPRSRPAVGINIVPPKTRLTRSRTRQLDVTAESNYFLNDTHQSPIMRQPSASLGSPGDTEGRRERRRMRVEGGELLKATARGPAERLQGSLMP